MLKGSSSLHLKHFGLLDYICARKLKVRLSEHRVERARCSPQLCCCIPALSEGCKQDSCWKQCLGHAAFGIVPGDRTVPGDSAGEQPRSWSDLARDHASQCASGIKFLCPGMFSGGVYFTHTAAASVFPALSFSSLFLKEVQS